MDPVPAPPRLILARPSIGENIGSVVRLCANFGIEDLVLVEPATGWELGARRTASMVPTRVEAIRVLPDLQAAVADCPHIFGLTARQGRDRTTEDLLGFEAWPEQGLWALVFGNEESGLSDLETQACQTLLRIDLPGLSSMNLSHAVAVVLAGWRRNRRMAPELPHPVRALADREGRERLRTKLLGGLEAFGFETADPHLEGLLRRWVREASIETRDLRMAERILRHLEWVREHGLPPEDETPC